MDHERSLREAEEDSSMEEGVHLNGVVSAGSNAVNPRADASASDPLPKPVNWAQELVTWYAREYGDYLVTQKPHFFTGIAWLDCLSCSFSGILLLQTCKPSWLPNLGLTSLSFFCPGLLSFSSSPFTSPWLPLLKWDKRRRECVFQTHMYFWHRKRVHLGLNLHDSMYSYYLYCNFYYWLIQLLVVDQSFGFPSSDLQLIKVSGIGIVSFWIFFLSKKAHNI